MIRLHCNFHRATALRPRTKVRPFWERREPTSVLRTLGNRTSDRRCLLRSLFPCEKRHISCRTPHIHNQKSAYFFVFLYGFYYSRPVVRRKHPCFNGPDLTFLLRCSHNQKRFNPPYYIHRLTRGLSFATCGKSADVSKICKKCRFIAIAIDFG